MSNTIKIIIVIVGVAGLAGIGSFYANSKSSVALAQSNSPLQSSTGVTAPLGEDLGSDATISDPFLGLLLNMRNIRFDESIFSNPSFTILQDFSTTIQGDGNQGRPNPFAPIGTDAVVQQQLFTLTTEPPTDITPTSAVLKGSISSGGIAQEVHFEYGLQPTPPFANSTIKVPQNLNTGAFVFTLPGLNPNTTYFVRGMGKIGGNPLIGNVVSFRTTTVQ